jgi:hypothetical protein
MSDLFVRGEDSGAGAKRRLLGAIDYCKSAWKDDRAYKDVLFALGKVEQDLDLIAASPGRRAALRASSPNAAGQEPSDRSEAPSEVQK